MPRTIPWLKDQQSSKAKSSAAPPPKRARPALLSPSTSEDERSAQRAHARQRREAARQAGRTPSTSPPPAPPAIEPMRPGLSHDDIYIMVEDEFLSTAQLFTSHLHHLEYVRLKNLAQARSSSSAAITSSLGGPQRPTDSITTMRAETLKKKQAEAKAGKNKLAIEQMKRDARGGIAVSDQSDDLDEDSDADTAPWAGTSLQGLMAPDARRQNLTSLSGLHGLKSSTRAAKGYDMQVDVSPGQNRQNQRRQQPDARPTYRHTSKRHANISTPSCSSSTSSNDDLDALTKRRPFPPSKPKPKPSVPSKPLAPTKPYNALTLAAEDLYQSTQSSSKPTKANAALDYSPPSKHSRLDSSPPSRDDVAAGVRKRIQARRERAAALEKKRKEEESGAGGGGNVNEIPIFLV
ncbi:MAG: hypothetical protein Q9184_005232 [Pyrenodesmia sp. 2 TL-2023]